jgi:PAS domain S-box-containing protein
MPAPRTGPKSIRAYLALLAIVSGVPLAALAARSGVIAYQAELSRASLQAIRLAEVTSASTVQFLSSARLGLTGTAARSSAALLDLERCREILFNTEAIAPYFNNIAVADSDGTIICSEITLPTDTTFSVAERDWFNAVRGGAEFTIGTPIRGVLTGNWGLAFAVPLLGPDGEFAGGLAGNIPLVRFQTILTGGEIPPDELVSIVSADRVILARSQDPSEHVGRVLPPDDSADVSFSRERTTASFQDASGIDRTWAAVELEDVGWTVYAGIPTETIRRPARALLTRSLLLGLFILLLVGTAAWAIERSITGSLRRLVTSTRSAGMGKADIVDAGPAEVQALSQQLRESFQARDDAESEQRTAKERYRSILDQAVFGIALTSEDGRFLEVNPALAAMLGYESPDTLLEVGAISSLSDSTTGDDLASHFEETGVVRDLEARWRRQDNLSITVRVNGRRVTLPDGTLGSEMIVEDVTGQKELEGAFRQSQKMEAVGRLAGGIAHDFNNLLTVVAGNTELLLADTDEADPRHQELTEIDAATDRAAALIRQLLAFSRKSPVHLTPVDMNQLVTRLEGIISRLIGEHIEVVTVFGEDMKSVRADPAQLEQVLMNLCVNARDAMPEGGTLTVGTQWVLDPPPEIAAARSPAGWIRVSVEDTGSGITPDVRERIFEPFFSTKPSNEGTGLGLATSYAVVDSLGGALTVSSIENVGSRFEVWLPADDAPGSADVASPDRTDAPAGTETILVVEDEIALRRFIERVLESAGYSVLLAEDGEQGLTMFQEHDASIDLVLTDVVMPKRSGADLAREIQATHPRMPLLFMSGYIADLPVKQLIGDDADLLMKKPFTISDLLFHVRGALDR